MVYRMMLLVGIGMLVAGCEANPKRADVEGRVLLEDDNLSQLIAVIRQTSDRIDGDLLRIRTEIKNKTEKDLWVDVQIVWKDKDGHRAYETNWAPLFLPGRFVTDHEVASMRADVADYEFRVRNAAWSKKAR
jgi:uncharacterized protein YcfL